MLDNDKRLAAFRELNKSGFTSSRSVVLATSNALATRNLSASLVAVVLPTVTYPASVQTSMAKITAVVAMLDAANTAAGEFASYFAKFKSPSELLNVSIGWDCHLKAEGLPISQAPALVDALGDMVIVNVQSNVLAGLSTASVVAVMGEINTFLAASAGTSAGSTEAGGGTASPAPSLSDDLIAKLAAACLELETRSKSLTGVNSDVIKLTSEGKQSVDTAKTAFFNAVGVSLLDSMKDNEAMGPAISAITPAAVTDALRGNA